MVPLTTRSLVGAVLACCLIVAGAARAGDADTGTVNVVNDTSFTLVLEVDGATKTTLRPGARHAVRGISPGKHRFQALMPDGQVKFQKEMRVSGGQTLSWILKWTRVRRVQRPFPR